VNGVQRIAVTLQAGVGEAQRNAPSHPHAVLPGAKVPPVPQAVNTQDYPPERSG
jgi:hypothetical protein